MGISALKTIVPAPVEIIPAVSGKFILSNLKTVSAASGLERFAVEAVDSLRFFGVNAEVISGSEAQLTFALDSSLGAESWELEVSENAISITGGDSAGVFYALQALVQITAAASAEGPVPAAIECGKVKDSPRFGWRSFMLDPARHFQTVETVKRVIRMMASYRLNILHWHLTDSQGWRIKGGVVSEDACLNTMTSGAYTIDELKEIADYAEKYFVEIVPEVDVPGHSLGLATAYRNLACDPENPGIELCIGNPETLTFVKKVFAEILTIFPRSRYIHIGGDEAALTHWEKCPRCQAAVKAGNFKDLRELENHFMRQVAAFITENGRTPIVWGTGTPFDSNTVIQAWLDHREPARHIANNCKCIMSVHNSYYFDYPADQNEAQRSWMYSLPEEAVYMADPFVIWESSWKDHLLGPEACLWTEYVPDWRVIQKILPRLGAYAEVAWSQVAVKDYYDFRRRSGWLRAAGYEEYLRSLI